MNFEVFVQVNMRILFIWDMTLCQWVGESKCWLKCPTTWGYIHPDTASHPKRRESSTFMKFDSSKFKVNSCAWNNLMFNSVKVSFNVMWKMITLRVMNNDSSVTSRGQRLWQWMNNDSSITSRGQRLWQWMSNDSSITSRGHRLWQRMNNDSSITSRGQRLWQWL